MSFSSNENANIDEDEDFYTVPLQDQRVFGAGIKRKRINFVPAAAASDGAASGPGSGALRGKCAAQRYLDIVSSSSSRSAPKAAEPPPPLPLAGEPPPAADVAEAASPTASPVSAAPAAGTTAEESLCAICNLPTSLTSQPHTHAHAHPHPHAHEALLAHQLSLPHQHAPSSLDRRRMGVRVLAAHGWDPDARTGLGKDGTGRRFPVRVVQKRDTVALGVEVGTSSEKGRKVGKKKKLLGAKEVRLLAARERVDKERLRGRVFGREEEVEKVLNGG